MYYPTYTFTDGYDVTDDGANKSTKPCAKSGTNLDPYSIANDVWSGDIRSIRRR